MHRTSAATERVDESAIAVIILTRGDRSAELRAAVRSVHDQIGVSPEVIVVANGVAASSIDLGPVLPSRVVEAAENLGIPGGRNCGADAADADILVFLDDDARFTDRSALRRVMQTFRSNQSVGAVALRIVDETGTTARRHIPRIGAWRPDLSGTVGTFLGGAVAIRARAWDDAGGYPAEFFYAMEETDLSLRLIDAEWSIWYDATPAVFHPATLPSRHLDSTSRTMRNRVWLAHRNLPWPIAMLYVVDWLAISAVREPRTAGTLAKAVLHAWRTRPGPRRPIRWRTVVRLTRIGRPPIV